jgi:hypothetical protein
MSSLLISFWSSSLSRNASCTDDRLHYPGSPIVLIILATPGLPIDHGDVISTQDLTLHWRTSPLSRIDEWVLTILATSGSPIDHGDLISTRDLTLHWGSSPLSRIDEWVLTILATPGSPIVLVMSSLPRISRCTGDPNLYPGLANGC